MSSKKRAGIYVRVSTVEQETDMQETELRSTAVVVAGKRSCIGIEVRAAQSKIVRH